MNKVKGLDSEQNVFFQTQFEQFMNMDGYNLRNLVQKKRLFVRLSLEKYEKYKLQKLYWLNHIIQDQRYKPEFHRFKVQSDKHFLPVGSIQKLCYLFPSVMKFKRSWLDWTKASERVHWYL